MYGNGLSDPILKKPSHRKDTQSMRASIARALSWTALESVGLSGLSFLTLLILARYLTPTDFGVASMALGIVQVLNVPVEMLFHDALIQRSHTDTSHFNTAFSSSALLGAALSLLCWVGAPRVSAALGVPLMRQVLPWMSLSLPLMGLGSAIIAYQRRHLLYRPLALRSLVGRLIGATAGITVAIEGGGVWSLVVQQVSSVGFATLALWIGCDWRPRPRWSLPLFRELMAFGLPAMSVLGLYFVGQRWFMLLAGRQLGAAAAGYLNLAFRTIDSLRDVSAGAVSQLALPLFARHQHDAAALTASFRKATSLSCTLMFPLFCSIAICAPDFVRLLFGTKWQAAAPLVTLMALLTTHYFARMFAAPVMSAVGKPHYPLPGQLAQLALITICMIEFGATSIIVAASIWAARLLLSLPMDVWFMKKASGLRPAEQLRPLLSPLLPVLALMAIEWEMRAFLGTIPSALAAITSAVVPGLAVYALLLYVLDARLCRELLSFGRLAVTAPRASAPAAGS